ncbi:hypothetical protein F8M41_014981 [Gigaspora margarita]|uniref:DUF659 domain-containing protein n=1 Tax=Gigaspora margarita TaxID=4874 RepID=A0A8H4AR86_GIGMA|nr:hypothetical protein F8M41_014981 [Gigaspora margarita]
MITKLQNDLVGPTLTFNGWTNIVNQNIKESVFISSKGEVLIWKGIDISSERERYKEMMLQLKYTNITFLPCFAHQMNLFVGEIFKETKEFREASINAIKVAAYFQSVQYKYFTGQLRDLQKESYSKYIAIAIGNDT